MFWKKKKEYSRDRVSKTSQNTIIYAVGDIHGQLDLLEKLHDLISNDSKNFENNVVRRFFSLYNTNHALKTFLLDFKFRDSTSCFT